MEKISVFVEPKPRHTLDEVKNLLERLGAEDITILSWQILAKLDRDHFSEVENIAVIEKESEAKFPRVPDGVPFPPNFIQPNS